MSGEVVVAPDARTWRLWDALRLAVIVLWFVAAAVTWWTAPREQSYAQARADVAAGRVTGYQWGDRWERAGPRSWFGTSAVQSSGELGPLFVWRTPDGRVWWTDTDRYGQLTIDTSGAIDEKSYSGAGAVAIAHDLQVAGVENRGGEVASNVPVVVVIGIVLAVVFLVVLVSGPAPVLGTRWFWFWVVYTVPLGLGLLFWLVRDRPWARSATPAVESGGVQRRDRGILGFGIGIVATIVIGVLLLILHSVLGDRWVPSPDA